MSYEVERMLRAMRSVLASVVGSDLEKECPLLDVFDQCFEHITEQNDSELIFAFGLDLPKKKCDGCNRKKVDLDLSTFD